MDAVRLQHSPALLEGSSYASHKTCVPCNPTLYHATPHYITLLHTTNANYSDTLFFVAAAMLIFNYAHQWENNTDIFTALL